MNTDKTLIANPLYDVVFRYMMEDNKVAKLFLSAIIGEEIEELVFNPTEASRKIDKDEIRMTVTRMDFSAKIRQENGTEKLILIELQKSKYFFQIMRFRRYLGRQYQSDENIIDNPEITDNDKQVGLPIYPIYILGEAFTNEILPVINIRRKYIDAATQAEIAEKYPFVEALTHDATIIQIPHLKASRRTVLEQFLEIFDQSNRTERTHHLLEINEADYPEKYHLVIRRLRRALATPKMEEVMELEDDIYDEFNMFDKRLAKAMKRESEALESEQKALESEQKAKESEQKALESEQKAKESEQKAKEKLVKLLYKTGSSISEIATEVELSEKEIKNILAL